MSKNNKISNKKNDYKSKKDINPTNSTYSEEQIAQLLKGYIMVSKGKWIDIPLNSHIRYIKKNGKFVRGGFVTSHWTNKEGQQFIHLANKFNKKDKNYATWPAAYDSIDTIYKKIEKHNEIELDLFRTKTGEIIREINKLVIVIKRLDTRLRKVEQHINLQN